MTDDAHSRWWIGVALSAAMPFLLLFVWEGAKATAVPAAGGPPEMVAAPGWGTVHVLLALLSTVGFLATMAGQTLFPAFLFLDARAIGGSDVGRLPSPWLCGLVGLVAVLPAVDALVPTWLPLHAVNPSYSIALVAVAYLALRHRVVGVP